MWLLNAQSRKLQDFVDFREVRGKYAILSHTWGKEEFTFDMIHDPGSRNMLGYIKIDFACRQAQEDNLEHAWIDTCCIDKRSSAELGEAINSMYLWYLNAKVCYAYLADVDIATIAEPLSAHAPALVGFDSYQQAVDNPTSPGRKNGLEFHLHVSEVQLKLQQLLGQSKWFTRGWTLQELIAPGHLRSYDHRWVAVGTKTELVASLSQITLISPAILLDQRQLSKASIAQKMSWAAHRTTSRIEDQAYCLMGIFDVNMPLLYGEGSKSFMRLQEEIIRTWDRIDHSILAWTGGGGLLLAPSPAAFTGQHHLTSWSLPQRDAFELSNAGLRISVLADVYDCFDPDQPRFDERRYVLVALNARSVQPSAAQIGLTLKKRIHIDTTDLRKSWTSETEDIVYERQLGLKRIDASQLRNFSKVELTIARNTYHLPRTTNKVLVTSECFNLRAETSITTDIATETEVYLYASLNADVAQGKVTLLPKTESDPDASPSSAELSLELVQRYDRHRLPELRLLTCRGNHTRHAVSFFEPGEEHIHRLVGLTAQRIVSKYTILGSEFMWHLHISDCERLPQQSGAELSMPSSHGECSIVQAPIQRLSLRSAACEKAPVCKSKT
ncbi:hypothetical protein CLAFUW4_07619 [Fulvia fulva]|uniref:Vegetative incompatibility protein HET-E-1 n=1 Tax=Passalora fulva TaxID=5499 RepID=A0A9Q8LJV8_PASFU|nr:Vegetative incompatibility protein HET-E-1 [Fulvia fulva]UJO18564.1 Vegetative incompatibility protein HET-E-1 [Fulvia fulva]WPV15980.1 hypothetical protein CLAFUW4_07619 [Fulvia fulva]WPV31198.1 hypothetical protein CLAFUW7_07620 [Fulvia fulva]